MRSSVLSIVLVCFFTSQVIANALGNPNGEYERKIRELRLGPEHLEKIKDKAVEIAETVKTGIKVAKCALHTIGEKVYPHTHQIHPCGDGEEYVERNEEKNGDDGGSSQPSGRRIDSSTVNPLIDVRSGDGDDAQTERSIHIRTNCESGFVADKVGICRERY